jgi:hypothetical protein
MGLAPSHGCSVPVPFSHSRKWDWLRVMDVRCLSHFLTAENGTGSESWKLGACPIFPQPKMGLAPSPENLTWSDLRRDNKESPGSGLRQIMSGNLAIRGSYARQSVGIRPSAVWRRQLHRTRHVRFSGVMDARCLSHFSTAENGTGSESWKLGACPIFGVGDGGYNQLLGIEGTAFWLSALAALLVGFSKTGLPGAAIPAVALMAEAFREDTKLSVGAMLPILLVGDSFALAYYRRHAHWARLWELFPYVLAGMVPGYLCPFGKRAKSCF